MVLAAQFAQAAVDLVAGAYEEKGLEVVDARELGAFFPDHGKYVLGDVFGEVWQFGEQEGGGVDGVPVAFEEQAVSGCVSGGEAVQQRGIGVISGRQHHSHPLDFGFSGKWIKNSKNLEGILILSGGRSYFVYCETALIVTD